MSSNASAVMNANTLDELLRLLETSQPEAAQEMKQVIQEAFASVKDPWLVNGMYEANVASPSPQLLELLMNVHEPHDGFLLAKLCEGVKAGGKARLNALSFLGYLIRKQPPWLYKITKNALMTELIKVLKTEDNLVILMSALMDLITIMPIIPTDIASYIDHILEVFSRLASWRYQHICSLPKVLQIHVQIGLYAFFHRLYGMFPCNFISFLRNHYSENGKQSQVFAHTIRPLLMTVRLHPLLVTHKKDEEKSSNRWKKMEVHDIFVESCRYSLLEQESCMENGSSSMEAVSAFPQETTPDIYSLCSALSHDPSWTPSRCIDPATPPVSYVEKASSQQPAGKVNQLILDSPPEAAIEATPETTPFVTPIKEEVFQFGRSTSSQTSRQLKVDVHKSPGAFRSASSSHAPSPKPQPMPSPMKDLHQPFKYPDLNQYRRDSIFERATSENFSLISSKLNRIGMEREAAANAHQKRITPTLYGREVENSEMPTSLTSSVKNTDLPPSSMENRPSPVKFTSQCPQQFPLKPEPERPKGIEPDAGKGKMMSLDNLEEFVPDFGKEEDDDEVSKITGAGDPNRNLSTRHITPQICFDSASGSTSISRVSTVSQLEPLPAQFVTPSKECDSGGIHAPSQFSVSDFVKQVKGRIRFSSVCGVSGAIRDEIVAATTSKAIHDDHGSDQILKRSISCPSESEMKDSFSKFGEPTILEVSEGKETSVAKSKENGENIAKSENGEKVDCSVQTEEFEIYPYEHLFPSVLPHWFSSVRPPTAYLEQENQPTEGTDMRANPFDLLDAYIKSSMTSDSSKFSLNTETTLLYNLLLYERHRREVLGLRNRRLLGKTKSSRILEEQNTALRDHLEITENEINTLLHQLETVRKEKHEVEEARVTGAKQRDKMIEELSSENQALREEICTLKTLLAKKESEQKSERKEMEKLEAGLFRAKAEVSRLESKENVRKMTEEELIHLRKQLLLQGELQLRYKEALQRPGLIAEKKEQDLTESFHHEMRAMKDELINKTNELEASKAKHCELEQKVTKKDLAISELKRIIEKIKDENLENVKAVEEANAALMESQAQMGLEIMQLHDKLAQATRPIHNMRITDVRGRAGSSGISGAMHSAGVDIAPRNRPAVSTPGSDDRSFVVGSPPLSSGSSEPADVAMRRALMRDSSDLERSREDRRSPEVGSAVSARENFGTSESISSMNGRH